MIIRDAKGNKYMLRLSDISKKTEKDKEYEMISSLWKSFAFYSLHAALYSIKWAKNYGEGKEEEGE